MEAEVEVDALRAGGSKALVNERIYLSPPHLSGEEENFLIAAIRSNWITTLGPEVDGFEKDLAHYLKAKDVVALSSGTAAIHLALKALGLQKGENVFCSTLTFVGSVNPILYEGGNPIFIDSEKESWNMCPKALERAIVTLKKEGKIPRIAIIVNLYGQSARYEELLQICKNYDIRVIEDAAESLGAHYQNRKSATWGDIGILSFNGNKIITTSGGGALVAPDLEIAKKIRFWATQARDPFDHYEHSEIGFNYRMSNLLAAVGRAQLKVLDDRVERKRLLFKIYQENLQNFSFIEGMPESSLGCGSRWLSTFIFDDSVNVRPQDLIQALSQKNIESRRIWKPMHLQPLFRGARYFKSEENSFSDRVFARGVVLPSGTRMSSRDQEAVIEIVKRFCLGLKRSI